MSVQGFPPPSELVDIGGRRLHYFSAGAGSPTVVFESGGGGGSSIQDLPVMRLVSAFARAIVYDRAGLGWSDPAPPGRTFLDRAGDLHTLLKLAEAPPPYVLVGASFGGLLARAYARRYPQDVIGMVLVDAAEEGKYFPTMARMRAALEQMLIVEARRAESGELRRNLEPRLQRARWFNEDEKLWALEVVSRASHFQAALEELTAIDGTPPEMTKAGGFGSLGDRPLIVLSRDQPLTGDMAPWEDGADLAQRRLASLSSNSRHIVAAGLGHSIAVESPPLVAASVAAVLQAVAGNALDTTEIHRIAAARR